MIATKTGIISLIVVGGGIAITVYLAAREDAPMRGVDAPIPIAESQVPALPAAETQPLRCGPETVDAERFASFASSRADLAEYLALHPPTGLSFDPTDRARTEQSLKRFNAWVEAKTARAKKLQTSFEKMGNTDVGAIVAASYVGLLSQSFADDLFTMPIPEDVRTGEFADEKVEAFCDKMTEVAEPLEARSLEAYVGCVEKARTLAEAASDDSLQSVVMAARPCLSELARLKPEQYPVVEEVFTASRATQLRIELGRARLEDGTGVDYDRENTLGVVLRTRADFAGARAAYRRAIAIDGARPAAHYNLGLLAKYEATTQTPEASIEIYLEATRDFQRAAERAGDDRRLREDALAQAKVMERSVRQTREFIAKAR